MATISRWQVLHLAGRWEEQPWMWRATSPQLLLQRPQVADCIQEWLSKRAEA